MPERRAHVPCPPAYAHVLLAERFGKWPWEIKGEPANEVMRYMTILGVEGYISGVLEGMPRTEQLILMDDD